MARFRKKPVVIEAVQWTNQPEPSSLDLILAMGCRPRFAADGTADLMIPTIEGEMRARVGDWIVKGIKGEFYPVKPDVFEATYEPVDF